MIFSNFSSVDEGRSREFICITDNEENAKRVVACVDACAGITTGALEAGYIKHLVEWDEVHHKNLETLDIQKFDFSFEGHMIKEDE